MKATIRDSATLSAWKPLEIVAYLRSSGWTKTQEKSGQWSDWMRRDEADEEYEVSIPLVPTFRDFADILRAGVSASDPSPPAGPRRHLHS